ncbi:MAG TPA: VTT domain-containing protein [Thermoanaerobaculia bacterium]|nr:VTT domain-containing protein [Thermoanaerobaculia bacterium]
MISRRGLRLGILVVLVGGVVALYFSPLRAYVSREHIEEGVDYLRGLWYGPIVLIASYGIGCIFAVPASIFIITAGIVWGWKLGVTYAMAGAMLGASASYFAGRFLGEGLLERFGRAGEAVSRQVSRNGFVSMLIARLIPGPPFAVWNYAAGIARMNFGEYFLATLIGTLPAHIVFAYCADALFNGTMTQGDAVKRLVIVAGLLISMIALTTVLKRRMARNGVN